MKAKFCNLQEHELRMLLEDSCSFVFSVSGSEWEVQPIMVILFDSNGGHLENRGFAISVDGQKRRRCQRVDTLLAYLNKQKILREGTARLVSINDRPQSFDEYIENKKFSQITMPELLKRYKDADTFSLTGVYNDEFSIQRPQGIYGIDEATAAKALQKVEAWSMNMLQNQYNHFTQQQKDELPKFQDLVEEISKECSDYFELVRSGKIPDGQSPFLADLIFSGKTKYSQPQGIWHFYHELYSQHMTYKDAINEMKANSCIRDVGYIFENPYYSKLKSCLVDTEITFVWHCTTSGRLAVVYYFAINDISMAWLQQLSNDYDMRELEDLAFYKNGNLLFSSCTHEGFHNDCRKG